MIGELMAKVIAFTNQKGGVGKTTSCVNLAAAFAQLHRRVLLIDMDPQGNATMGSGVNKKELKVATQDVLMGEADITSAIVGTAADFDILPTNGELTAAEVGLLQVPRREFMLSQRLLKVRGTYDYILIDCPPSLNMLTINALSAADSVIIPMQCEYYALEGLSGLLETIEQLKQSVNPQLYVQGILRTMYDGRNLLAVQVSEQLIQHFGDKVYKQVVPRNVRLAEAPSHGLPGVVYDKRSAGALSYLSIAQDIVQQQAEAFANDETHSAFESSKQEEV